jgi:hypothetical protein
MSCATATRSSAGDTVIGGLCRSRFGHAALLSRFGSTATTSQTAAAVMPAAMMCVWWRATSASSLSAVTVSWSPGFNQRMFSGGEESTQRQGVGVIVLKKVVRR